MVSIEFIYIAEANYAFRLEKEIIPLKLQEGYTAKGWLGFIESTEYFYKFTNEEQFEENCNKLLHAIQTVFKNSKGTERPDSTHGQDTHCIQELGPVVFRKEDAANKKHSTATPNDAKNQSEEKAESRGGHRDDEQTTDNLSEKERVENPEKEDSDGEAHHNTEVPKEDGGPEDRPALDVEGNSDERRVGEDKQEIEYVPEHTCVSGGQSSDEDKEEKDGSGDAPVSGHESSDEKEDAKDEEVKEDEIEDPYVSVGESSDKENVTEEDNGVRNEQTEEQNVKRTEPSTESKYQPTVHTDQPTGEISASQELSDFSRGGPLEETADQRRQSNHSSDSVNINYK